MFGQTTWSFLKLYLTFHQKKTRKTLKTLRTTAYIKLPYRLSPYHNSTSSQLLLLFSNLSLSNWNQLIDYSLSFIFIDFMNIDAQCGRNVIYFKVVRVFSSCELYHAQNWSTTPF